ncbi:MAG: DciA family protein [Betaproteobacteria bacterium]
MTGTRVGVLLNDHPDFRPLRRQVEQLAILQTVITEILPAGLTVRAVLLKAGELTLYADNGAVAAKLKHLAPRILAKLRQRGYEVTGIHLQVQTRIRDNPLPTKQICVGSQGRSAIQALAEKLPRGDLKVALSRLARRI